jgi:peroxiredoxin
MVTVVKKLEVMALAPDFELKDIHGKTVRLSDYRGRQPVVLVITRGFI